MKKLIVTILIWMSYLLSSFILWFIGHQIMMFYIYDVIKFGTTEAEWERFKRGELVYTSIAIVLFIIGSILLYLLLAKKMKQEKKPMAIPE